jgi:glycosyltransferase involved in cell wall biosynthesis
MIYRFLIPVIEAQKKRGDYVCVCGSDDADAQKLRSIGIDVFEHHLKRGLNPFSLIKSIFQIKRILVEQRMDVIICHAPIAGGVGRIAAKLANTPNIIYFVHGYTCAPAQSFFKWLAWFCIEKVLGKFTDAALVMNDYDERLCKNYRMVKDVNKVFRISGVGVNIEKFKEATTENDRRQVENELGIPENKKIILSTAFLIPAKGIFVLLKAAKKICARRNDVHFLLAGEGPCKKRLISMRNSFELEEHFEILGWRNDIHRLMRSADIFVLPTYYWEGLPVSILEAMACGKPVIATKQRGCDDAVVDSETGYLIPVKQVEPLVDKIDLLATNEAVRIMMGRAGRKRVEQYFASDICTDKIVKALECAYNEKKFHAERTYH